VLILALLGARGPVLPAAAQTFQDCLGFEDDVDLVVAPDGHFLVICEEALDGSSAQVTINDLDAATGFNHGPVLSWPVLGFEQGVDPIVVPELEAGTGYTLLVPTESADGSQAELVVLLLDENGGLFDSTTIELGDLGFREDVDGIWSHYLGPVVAFFPLENEDRSVRGLLAVDADPRGDGDIGGCSLLSTDGRAGCGETVAAGWLPGLVEGVDPVAYEKLGCCVRTALPVTGDAGSDLLIVSFDPNDVFGTHPLYEDYFSVRELNAGGVRPTDFPGYERDVDPTVFKDSCGAGFDPRILVPVEGPGDVGDIYLLDQDGNSLWVLSLDSGSGLAIPGFEAGVDVVPMCGLPVAPNHRLAVPVENAAGTDADLWFVDLTTGELVARVEDPAINPTLVVPGYEVGVEPLLWTSTELLVPVEGPGIAGLLAVYADATLADSIFNGPVLGFMGSVDPVVLPLPGTPRTVFVPVCKADDADANLLAIFSPPTLGYGSFEAANPGESVQPFEWDLDPGLIRPQETGGSYIYLPELMPDGSDARVRFELVPSLSLVLAMATREHAGNPAKLYLVNGTTGAIAVERNDVLGLQRGLDFAGGRGPLTGTASPALGLTPGFDVDSDPTLSTVEHSRLTCIPCSGTLPFTSTFSVRLFNNYNRFTRRIAAHLDVTLANGSFFSSWHAGYTNIPALSSFTTTWGQNFPNLGSLRGDNVFELLVQDVTPAPFNHAPHPPAGDSGTDACTVTTSAP
jgi:hypothetical protein